MEQDKPKVGAITASIMLIVAGFFDFLQFVISLLGLIPTGITQALAFTISTPLTVFAYMAFFFWFAFLNVSFFNMKKPMSFFGKIGGLVAESLPLLTAAPILSTAVLFTLIEANGAKGFPASLVPKFLLSMTPAGKVVQAAKKMSK